MPPGLAYGEIMVYIDDAFSSHDDLVEFARCIHPGAMGGPSLVDLREYLVAPRLPVVIDEQASGLLDGPLVGLAMHGQ